MKAVKLSEIKFREDLYPRIAHDPITVQKYAEDISVLPPIEVNQHNEIIDGWHRWTAHKKVEAATINVVVTETQNESQFLELAIERNATHGLQLSQEDKQDMTRRIYLATPEKERIAKKKHLAKILSVSPRSIQEWLSRIDKDSKEARNKRIFAYWLACWTQEEIAEKENMSQPQVVEIINELSEYANLPKPIKTLADHAEPDFTPPIYNVWKWQEKTKGVGHFGNSESTILDNLLYLYTKPYDIIVDPFAGGGSSIEVCKKRLRRLWVSDRKPIPGRERDIRRWSIQEGIPPLNKRWSDVGLVYLDPPYWKQAEGKYSNDPDDLANMPLDKFTDIISVYVQNMSSKLPIGAAIALLMQPTQWNADNRQYTDHIIDIIGNVGNKKLSIDMRVSCPYESQQHNAQMVTWAKDNKKLLVLTRELIVWRITS